MSRVAAVPEVPFNVVTNLTFLTARLRRFFVLLLQRALCLIDNGFKRPFICEGEIGENFAIKSNTGGFQSFREAAVSHSVGTGGGVESLDPEITKGSFSGFAIAIGPVLAFHRRVFCVAEKFRAASAIAFGLF